MEKITVKKRYICLILGVVIIGVLFAVSLISQIDAGLFDKYIPPNILLLILGFAVTLPILLLIFLFVIISGRRRRPSNESIADDNVIEEKPTTAEARDETEEENTEEEAEEEVYKPRFFMLGKIDEEQAEREEVRYNEEITLREICDKFRNFAAYNLKLYFDIGDIRKFIAGLCTSKILILQGISGTGKTSMVYAFGEFINNSAVIIPVQPMWKERTDLIGYYNEFTKRFNETILLQKMYEANYSKSVYVTLLDEMNIARIEYYFAEFLSLLELPNPEKRYIDVVSDIWENDPLHLRNGQIKLPTNMWFIGTANNDDTTFAISDKVYDRAMMVNLDNKSEPFEGEDSGQTRIAAHSIDKLTQDAIKEYRLTRRNQRRLENLDKFLIEHFHITFGNRIRKQIMTYVSAYIGCGGNELEALDDILTKKLLRKLEAQNPIILHNTYDSFVARLDELFGETNMQQVRAYLARLNMSV